MQPTYKNISAIIFLTILAYFSWLMFKIVALYVPMQLNVGFLLMKQAYLPIDAWRFAFFVHVFSGLFALMAGFTQFSPLLLKTRPTLHRRLGYVYVINVLCVTGPAGLIMSYYANGGTIAIIAFMSLSVLWVSFTAMALYKVIKRDITAHRAFMMRSYALTLSAISLRVWKVLLEEFTNISPDDRYRIIAWLGWGLNLLIAEIIILRVIKKQQAKTALNLATNQ